MAARLCRRQNGYELGTSMSVARIKKNDTVIAMSPADLKKVPGSILISGGLYKAGIIRAILTAGYVNHLVTDEAVARKLLGQD